MGNFSIHGRVQKFGDNINTDLISPAPYIGMADEIMIAHAMEGADPDFSKKVKPGDILVAGKNFGSGSSRETAPFVIKGSGIAVIIAEFYARIFYRNAINIGLPILESCDAAAGIRSGDEIEIDMEAGLVRNLTTGQDYRTQPQPEFVREIIRAGGLLQRLKSTSNQD